MRADPDQMSQARQEAIRRARQRFEGRDLALVARSGGLELAPDGSHVELRVLGALHRLGADTLRITRDDGRPVHPTDELLVLRYLLAERAITPSGEAITFRDLPGGLSYHGVLARRTTDLLLEVFADDVDRLRRSLEPLGGVLIDTGDLGLRIPALGRIEVILIYRQGDPELAATATLLYDRVIGAVFSTEEVAALATRICAIAVSASPE